MGKNWILFGETFGGKGFQIGSSLKKLFPRSFKKPRGNYLFRKVGPVKGILKGGEIKSGKFPGIFERVFCNLPLRGERDREDPFTG